MAAKAKPDSPAVKVMKRLNQQDAAWLLGVTARAVRDWRDLPRNLDRTYDGQAILKWASARAVPSSSDPLLSGGTSPALEAYRTHRAGLAEMDLKQRKEQVVSVDELMEWWEAEVAGPVRRSLEALKRQHGEAAAELVAKPLRKASAAVEKRKARGGLS